jgi:DNA-binding MarR family transcriptional regulator
MEQTVTAARPDRASAPLDSNAALGDRASPRALDLDNYVPAQVAYLANRLTSTATAAYRPKFGVGLSDWRIIATLGQEPWISASRVCEATGMDKGAVSRSLRDLIGQGLVEMRGDAANQRRHLLALTAKGLVIHDHLVSASVERERLLLAGFSSEEKSTIQNFLARLKKNVESLSISRSSRTVRED